MPPKKSFGQHFLCDASVVEKIIAAADPAAFSVVVEVGPGEGVVTRGIVEARDKGQQTKKSGPSRVRLSRTRDLVLIEADRDLIAHLAKEFPKAAIIQDDAAQVDYSQLIAHGSWLLIGNLPYNAANAIIMNALESANPPERMLVMVQKEVGERMLGLPSARGLLTVAVGVYATVERVCVVPPGAFVPPPKVDSMVLRLTRRPAAISKSVSAKQIIALAKAGFSSRRKQLHRNLAEAKVASREEVKTTLSDVQLRPDIRAEALTVEDWVRLAERLFCG